jgi:type VI secretion system protein
MQSTLIDTLLGDDVIVVHPDSEAFLLHSIGRHVEHLLNTRQGSLVHMPDLGLPDLTEIYRALPESSHDLMAEIKQCLEKYEPRLSQIRVYQQENSADDSVVNLLIEARVVGQQQAKFITLFANDGHASVDYRH